MQRTIRTVLGLLTVLAALHLVYAYEVRGVPVEGGQCVAMAPPA
jgi:hypothetical protein